MEPSAYALRVLAVVEQVPPGRVVSYGDVAELMGEGAARGVGSVMARWGAQTSWWRVLRADGTPALCHDGEAMRLLRGEGVALSPGGTRVDLRRSRWDGTSSR